jgi:hypothetical protein
MDVRSIEDTMKTVPVSAKTKQILEQIAAEDRQPVEKVVEDAVAKLRFDRAWERMEAMAGPSLKERSLVTVDDIEAYISR